MDETAKWREAVRRFEEHLLPLLERAPQPHDPIPALDAFVFDRPFTWHFAEDVRVVLHVAPLAGQRGVDWGKAILRGFDEAQAAALGFYFDDSENPP